MIKVVTAKEMQDIDRTTIGRFGIAGVVLMERAGLSVVSRIYDEFIGAGGHKDIRKVLVFCGGGNNGGDGFVIARILHNQGRDVVVYMTSPVKSLRGDARINYETAKRFGVVLKPVKHFMALDDAGIAEDTLFVDALLGTGLNKAVRSPLDRIIQRINGLGCKVISVDIPSGISSDDGQVMGCAVKADVTVTFGLPKRGHLIYPGAGHAGKLYVEDIGFPASLLHSGRIRINLFERGDAARILPPRSGSSHKGSFGHILIVGGSKGKTGAALMAAKACLKSGAGLVTIGIPETLVSSFKCRVTEEMLLPLPDSGHGTLHSESVNEILSFLKTKGSVLAIGPGLSVTADITKILCILINRSPVPMVIDADGLNALAGKTGILQGAKMPIVLTPHPGEMSRLAGRVWSDADRIDIAVAFARRTRSFLVLKGAPTVTASPEGDAYINSSGNPGMATAGTGDVLTGMISALLAQVSSPLDAALLGVYVHGLAGDIAASKKGEVSLVASDLIRTIPGAYVYLRNG